jgi:C4-dicarboxylate-specific signal transduction histidine kinase
MFFFLFLHGSVSNEEVEIHEGIESTLTMLGHKLKNVTSIRSFDRSAPRILIYGSELNQVGTNLIDNAIHAVNICVGTCVEDNQLHVEIADNGTGNSSGSPGAYVRAVFHHKTRRHQQRSSSDHL